VFPKRLAGLFQPDLILKLQLDGRAAGKVDAEIRGSGSYLHESKQSKQNQQAGDTEGHVTFPHEIDIRLSDNFQHLQPQDTLDAQPFEFASIDEIKNDFGPDQRGKQIDRNAQAQGHGKPLDGTRAE